MTSRPPGVGQGAAEAFDDEGPLDAGPLIRRDTVELQSIGVDIGSSGTQVVVSRLHVRRMGESLSARFRVENREELHRSRIMFTPFDEAGRIGIEAVAAFVDLSMEGAGIEYSAIDTGVVILTGDALDSSNARRVGELMATRGGNFVCLSAGHHYEAVLAAFGSGSVLESVETARRILNVDIGGGTTKFAIAERGEVTATSAIGVGGRLVVMSSDRRIVRINPMGRLHAERAGNSWTLGTIVTQSELEQVASQMADVIVRVIEGKGLGIDDRFLLTERIDLGSIEAIRFSGGVAEYIYGLETEDFGDLGPPLSEAILQRIPTLSAEILPPGECIRATALGASEHTVQISGQTCFITDPGSLLPRRNLAVVSPRFTPKDTGDARYIARTIEQALQRRGIDDCTDAVIAIDWSGPPSHARVVALAIGIKAALTRRRESGRPMYLVLQRDLALTLGSILRAELGVSDDLVVVDGIRVTDLDFIDLGGLLEPSGVLPVTVKSLLFRVEPSVVA